MKKVYIASPYTQGDMAVNVGIQIKTASELIDLGFCPYVPTLNHFIHMFSPKDYETWMSQDFEWVKKCDFVLRLGGYSPGADREIELAINNDIPVVYNIEQLLEQCA